MKMQTTDWFQLITDLMQSGTPMRKIGEAMGLSQLTGQMLVHYRAGVEPLHWRGEALVTFWSETTGRPREERPMRDRTGRYRANIVGVRPSHPSKAGQVEAPASAPAPTPAPAPVAQPQAEPSAPARRKPGPKPGTPRRRKVAEAV